MKNLLKLIIALLLSTNYILASTKMDVKQLVEDGITLCNKQGTQECLKVFNDKKGPFVKGSLYIFAIDYNAVVLAHGGNPKIVGKNLFKVKDRQGIMLFQEFINIAKSKGEGWLDYRWSHPKTKEIRDKSSFVKAIGNDILIGAGYYK